MRYWGLLAVKLMIAAAAVVGLWTVVSWMLPPAPGGLLADWPRFGSDLSYTFGVGLAVIVGFGLGWLCAVDQVYRCRVCARRLKMPQSEGNFARVMLGGTPFTEYICTYGHGKLTVPDVHLASSRAMRWIGYGSLWENLMEAEHRAEQQR
ncbi:MAG: hypothetical protein ACRD1A_12015 [Terriglobales bacterium]